MAVAAVGSAQGADAALAAWAAVLAGESAPALAGEAAPALAGEAAPVYDPERSADGVVEFLAGLDGENLAAVGTAVVARLGGHAAALTELAIEAVRALGGWAQSGALGGPAQSGAEDEQAARSGAEDDAELIDSVAGLARLERAVAAERHRRVAAVDARGAYRARGHRSTEDLLATALTLSRGQAKAEAATARGLARLPRTAGRLAEGALGVDQAQIAARAAVSVDEQLPQDTPDEERADVLDELDELAADQFTGRNRGQVKASVDAWRHALDARYLVTRERRAHRDRGLTLGTDDSPGRVRLSHHGRAVVHAALEALARPRERGDTRSQAQRTHDALVELCQRHLDAGALPDVAAQRPHTILITTQAALDARPNTAPSWLDGVGAVSATLAALLVCDSEVTEVVVDQDGQPLVVTEPAKPTRPQRLAVIARDRACIGCGAPASRCQLHHRVWRRHGGATVTANLVLVCQSCHWRIHYDHWHVTPHEGGFRIDPPQSPDPPGDPPRDPPDDPPDAP